MEILYSNHQRYIKNIDSKFKRSLAGKIEWNNRLIGLKGVRGVGKTTLLLQRIKDEFGNSPKALYVSMDNLAYSGYSLMEIASHHESVGGTHLFIDELHKSENWSLELKSIYDLYDELSIVFTSSSILEIDKGEADLSRRAIIYELNGLSFREFLVLETGIDFEILSLEEVLKNHVEIANQIISKKIKPLKWFGAYLQYGYMPYFIENKNTYCMKVMASINSTLEVDLVGLKKLDPVNIIKLKRLMYYLSVSVPYQPNISKLAGSLEISRNTLLLYMEYLSKSKLVSMLKNDSSLSYSTLAKPEKIYLQNPNFVYCLNPNEHNLGHLRETFFLNQLSFLYPVNSIEKGDFMVDRKYTFEVGGPKKNFSQIAGIEDSYLAVDAVEYGFQNKIPLWLFGFLY